MKVDTVSGFSTFTSALRKNQKAELLVDYMYDGCEQSPRKMAMIKQFNDALDVFENSESDATLILGEKNGFAQAVLVSSEGKYTMSPGDYVEYWAKNAIDLIGKTAGLVKEDYCECGDAYMDAIINGVPTKGATLSRLV